MQGSVGGLCNRICNWEFSVQRYNVSAFRLRPLYLNLVSSIVEKISSLAVSTDDIKSGISDEDLQGRGWHEMKYSRLYETPLPNIIAETKNNNNNSTIKVY